MDDIHATATAFYMCKITNGHIPQQVSGGPCDGLAYFEIEIRGDMFWLTEAGLRIPTYEDGRLNLTDYNM